MLVSEQATVVPMDWSAAGRTPDWRNGVGERTRQLWSTFSDDLKIALAEDAHELVSPGAR